jgi:hypothetical protein
LSDASPVAARLALLFVRMLKPFIQVGYRRAGLINHALAYHATFVDIAISDKVASDKPMPKLNFCKLQIDGFNCHGYTPSIQ